MPLIQNPKSSSCFDTLKQKFKDCCCCVRSQEITLEAVFKDLSKTQRGNKALLERVNLVRNDLIRKRNEKAENSLERNQLKEEISKLEIQAVKALLNPQFVDLEEQHLHLSNALEFKLGVDTYIQQHLAHLSLDEKASFKDSCENLSRLALDGQIDTGLAKGTFEIKHNGEGVPVYCEQHPALNQLDSNNKLCSYYALYYLIVAYRCETSLEKANFLDRSLFNRCFENWSTLIYHKRTQSFLAGSQNKSIEQLKKEIACLTDRELQFLIENSPQLAALKEVENLFFIEVGGEPLIIDGENIALTDRSSINSASNKYNPNKPAYCILKVDDAVNGYSHYHFCKITPQKESFKADFVHSSSRSLFKDFMGNELLKNNLQAIFEALLKE